MHLFIYTVVVLSVGIYADFLVVSYYSMVDVLVVHTQMLYYNHNNRKGKKEPNNK